jgi:hypothetical protein
MSTWPLLTPVPADTLVDARLQLHHAAQIVTAVGISFLEPAADDSHTGFTWRQRDACMLGEGPTETHRFALRPRDLSLLFNATEDAEPAVYSLHGRTIAEAYDWVRERLSENDLDPGRLTSEKHYEISPHRVAEGQQFDASAGDAFAGLSDWYAIGWRLAAGARRADIASDGVRIWPHHFDIARLNKLSHGGKTIGVGMTPGDNWYHTPYLYVGPYPYPEHTELPALPEGGRWHTEGWFGAVLTSEAMWSWTEAAVQEAGALAFVDGAFVACSRLMGEELL